MTWFRVDDSFSEHPKTIDMSDGALALWLRAALWSSRRLTDGFIPRDMLKHFSHAPQEFVPELISRGLWHTVRGGFQFHDWDEWNPTKKEVEARRRADRERQARHRARRRGVTPDSRRESRRTNGVTGGKGQVRGGVPVTRESQRPEGVFTDPSARARGAPDGPAAPASRDVAEQALKEIREKLATKRRNGKPDG